MQEKPKPFANRAEFYTMLGCFYAAWSSTEIAIDCAIWKVLRTTPEQTHALVASMEFGRKVAVLRSLFPTSEYENVEQLKGLLTRITRESLRNVFSHSFLASDERSVTFIHRSSQGQYSAKAYQFTADQFANHVQQFVELAHELEKALGLSCQEIADFAAAAVPLTSE